MIGFVACIALVIIFGSVALIAASNACILIDILCDLLPNREPDCSICCQDKKAIKEPPCHD